MEELNTENIEIRHLVWDPLTSGFSICNNVFPLYNLFKLIISFYGLIYPFFKTKRNQKDFPKSIESQLSESATGYIITVRKVINLLL